MNEKDNIPKHWQVKKLGEVCDFLGGGTPSKNINTYWNGKIPWASIKDIKGQYLSSTIDTITEEGVKGSATNIAIPNEIILATRINPGRPIISKIRTAINQDLKIVKPKGSINLMFLYYSFLNIEREVVEKSKGTTVLGITLNVLNDIFISIPPLPEQQAIVSKIEELFSDLDNGIQQLEKAQQQLKVYRQSLLKWAFEGKLTNKDVKDGELPEGWKWERIDDVALSLDSKRKPINKEERLKRIGPIPYYGANGRVGWIDDFIFDEPLVCVVEDETFVGRTIPFSYKITGKTWVNNHAHILKSKENIDIDFLNYQLSYYPFLPLTTGTTGRKKLTKNALMNAPIKICSLQEQQLIVDELESKLTVCNKIEETITQSLQQAESLRQSILKKAFEGKLL